MFSPLLLQGLGIEPWKSGLWLDTLTTDPIGTIYTSVEISRSDKAFEESLTADCGQSLFHAAALSNILSN